ncbi:MAG: hypothetical protein OHK0046_20450 [Anaerolineae bacterium]
MFHTPNHTPIQDTASDVEAPLTEAERNALRAYLGRTEVRFSTMHRIATAFIGGAGLLLLIPVFFRDVVDGILTVTLASVTNYFPQWGDVTGGLVTAVMFVMLMYPFLLSLAIPLYGVYLLLKDVVHFYFTLYAPGFSVNELNPSLSILGLTFSPDESPEAKRRILAYQYRHMEFMIPFSGMRRKQYFESIAEQTREQIIPPTRHPEHIQDAVPPDADPNYVRHFNIALGIGRTMERQLVEEVAIMEMALNRNAIYLRRLVLRYIKTFLMFIWTTVVSFLTLPFLEDPRLPTLVVLGVSYLIWSSAVMVIVRQPLTWIYRHRRHDGEMNIPQHVDEQMMFMERRIRGYCYAAIIASVLGLGLALAATL